MNLSRFRPRFSVLRLMVVVAIIAILITGVRLTLISTEYNRRSIQHETMEIESASFRTQLLEAAIGIENGVMECEKSESIKAYAKSHNMDLDRIIRRRRSSVASNRRRALFEMQLSRYHAVLKEKYARAALHPWLRVEPDPTEPEYSANWPDRGRR